MNQSRSTQKRRHLPPGLPICISGLLVTLACLPAKATGFLDINNGWTGATECPDLTSFGCVENVSTNSVTLIGYEASNTQLTYTSQTVPANGLFFENISFSYSFDALANQTAFYTFAGTQTQLNSTGGSFSYISIPGTLNPGESVGFGVTNGDTDFFAQLDIVDFAYTGVPAPIPLLGGTAAIGWIRKRRATLRSRQEKANTLLNK